MNAPSIRYMLMRSNLKSMIISMKCDAINVTVKQLKTGIFDFQLFSASRLDYVYLGGAIKGVGWI